MQRFILVLAIIFSIMLGCVIYIMKPRPNRQTVKSKLYTVQEYVNSSKPYPQQFPTVTRPSMLTRNLSPQEISGLKTYLSYLYPAFTNIDSFDSQYLYNLFNSFTIYYNKQGSMPPITNITIGWLAGPDNPTINPDDCVSKCYPYCEPGFCDLAVNIPFAPVGYFAEFQRYMREFSRPDDVMSIGQTGQPYGPTGQWVTKYVDEDPVKMSQDEIILKRSINDPKTVTYACSMDMWNPFVGRGISFLQGNTFHRTWWYPNGAPGQIKNPLNPSQIFIPVDAYALTSPGLDFGMISSASGNKITLNMCINDINNFLEYLDMKGDIPTISWVSSLPDIANRFNAPGRPWSGNLETSATKQGNSDYYYTEFARTDFGTNFAYTGNWINTFEGAGIFYKYYKTLVAPNKIGALVKLFWRGLNGIYVNPSDQSKIQELIRRIIGVDYYNNNSTGEHNPALYTDGNLYSNQVGVTQGMCMGSSLPGRTGKVILNSSDPNSGAKLWYDAWSGPGNKSNDSLIYLGLIWLLCNSSVHAPNNDTTYIAIYALANGLSGNTWSFFSYWAHARNYDITTPTGLLQACKTFVIICAMGSGGNPAENYLVNAWQNTTLLDTIMFVCGTVMDYDLLQLSQDITENNMWTREAMAMRIPPDLIVPAKTQAFAEGPHGGSFLLFVLQFGTKYTANSPIFVGKNIQPNGNPTSFDRNPDSNMADWIPVNNPYLPPLGPPSLLNQGDVVIDGGSRFVSNSNFNTMLFTYYVQNDIITLRNPTNLMTDPTPEQLQQIRQNMGTILNYPYDRDVNEASAYNPDGTKTLISYNPNIPVKRRGQRCFGDWCAFFATNSQTQAWGRQATGYAF